MAAITPESTPAEDGHNTGAAAFTDDGILNAWLSTNPAPGTYREYKRTYFARQNRAERTQPSQGNPSPLLPTQKH
jgi:predicted alpha/beta hydrolase